MSDGRLGIACRQCDFKAYGPGAPDGLEQHQDETGHTGDRWLNVYTAKQKASMEADFQRYGYKGGP